ncbi:MAG: tetratricopeptide repeat protein [Mucilaginibacter sp.]|uniref:tetratricopeptide repeat protein n=1 Tax=Mucilaginibacter sp. L3T2-6 TaxID=3062491 RepID=UPI002675E84A|nr:tetratricopeptide repeat protein [Mucilaginibacter sp. L3T2-6]MDO3644158.1 tetratricopeptide repeat protein [Mucilaginibacter sp. L3T2-6]MDV6216561.1 tetratricopeptide repeat protein [Mucilaginibacter sp. L3T2-6]
MNKFLLLVFSILFAGMAFADGTKTLAADDTTSVIQLNKQGFDMRLTSPEQTIADGKKALAMAKKLNYVPGMAEAYRVIGIGYYYLDESVKAINNYLTALNYFQQLKDLASQGKVYNNIGNLYRYTDYDLSLEFFNKTLVIAKQLSDEALMAGVYNNMGTVYYHKNSFNQALIYYEKSSALYNKLKDSTNIVQLMQNKGLMYFNLHQYDKAEELLLKANKAAHQLDLNEVVAGIDLILAEQYIAQEKFAEANKAIEEGTVYAGMIKSDKMKSDFEYTSYQLESKRKNYEKALRYLRNIYTKDSLNFKQGASTQIKMMEEQVKQQDAQRKTEILLQRQANDRIKFWAVTIVAGLLLVLVGLLVSNVKRKAKTNEQLSTLNDEVSRQKDNLDRINHHLEEIIDERTKDLQIKNKKLSEYSSYLSHQIRGPIATLKGLMNLEKEGLVDQPECIRMMNKCVGEIDNKIIEMSDMLHDPVKTSL